MLNAMLAKFNVSSQAKTKTNTNSEVCFLTY